MGRREDDVNSDEAVELRDALVRAVLVFGQAYKSALDAELRPFGQTQGRWRVLEALARVGEGASQKALAAELGIEEPGLARHLEALEARGQVRRGPAPSDRRAKLVWFTPAGRAALAVGQVAAQAVLARAFGATAQDLEGSVMVLTRALAQLER